MDIRRFFKKPKLSIDEDIQTGKDISPGVSSEHQDKGSNVTIQNSDGQLENKVDDGMDLIQEETLSASRDIGKFISEKSINDVLKYELLKEPWTPSKAYDFKSDLNVGDSRAFRYQWLVDYSTWLCYSRLLKGAMCKMCVLFTPVLHRGVQGRFICKPFTKYKDFHNSAKEHMKSTWHKESSERAINFLKIYQGKEKNVHHQTNSGAANQITINRTKLQSILSTIIFCGTHDSALRGKTSDSGVFHDLLLYRIEGGDVLLQQLINSANNAKYTSHRIQNELIFFCERELRNIIVTAANESKAFSVIADETADISGTEQLSIAIRYMKSTNNEEMTVHEEFLGFQPLSEMNAKSIAHTILNFLTEIGLDLNKLAGQGYDGCSTMAGREGGVAKLIQNQYPKAIFSHCASHRLNLVINDLNQLTCISNSSGTIKEIIRFFRESPLRRKRIPNVPLFCETRWSSKYQSIRIFSEKFILVMDALKSLLEDKNVNKQTRQNANILHCSASNSGFIIAMHIMAKYSGILEPVTNTLQTKGLEIFKVREHVLKLLDLFRKHRIDATKEFKTIMEKIEKTVSSVDPEIIIARPRLAGKQVHRENYEAETAEDYYRVSMFIPYLDSIIESLECRFGESNLIILSLYSLHPSIMNILDKEKFLKSMKLISDTYQIERFMVEAEVWYDLWQSKGDAESLGFLDLMEEAKDFYPAISEAIEICISMPATSCTSERSFSTLRRVKTWLRSTMGDERLSGLCMMSTHRDRIKKDKQNFQECVMDRFAQEAPRRLQLL